MYQYKIVSMFILVSYFGSPYVIAATAPNATADDECYCLVKRLSNLRNPVHISETKLNGANIYLIAEQIGIIREYNPSAGTKLTTYLDLSTRVLSGEEQGLLGIALHPGFAKNRKLYTYSTRRIEHFGEKKFAVVSEVTDKDLDKEIVLLVIEQPGEKRNGGQLLFGDDGYLYVFVGDGEPGDSTDHNEAQNPQSLLGKILRLDVDNYSVRHSQVLSYSVPDDNPKMSGWRPEIYAMGIRNMWRCGMDRGDSTGTGKGRIFCGDLGGNITDEMNLIVKGGNYGWNFKEGDVCLNITVCGGNKLIENEERPIYTFNQHSGVQALVGGPVYRGQRFTRLGGRIVVGDAVHGALFTLKEKATGSTWSASNFSVCPSVRCACDARATPLSHLLSFGETHEGEVFVLMTDDLTPSSPSGALLELLPASRSEPGTCGATAVLSTYTVICVIIHFVILLSI